jgi:Amt family ammonium transporter
MRFGAMIAFTVLWSLLVYAPVAHWVWEPSGWLAAMGVLDFAGGTVVHINAGAAGLVCAYVLGPRAGYGREPFVPFNLALTLAGASLLWVGWFGFNAGSAVSAGALATSAFAATHFSAAAGALSWTVLEWSLKGKPSVLGTASGMVAGLATITPASGFVSIPAAALIGLAGGAACYVAVTRLKAKFRYDDSLDVFGVHGVGSTVGMVLVGVLASAEVNPAIATTFKVHGASVSLAGSLEQLRNQIIAIAVTAIFSGIATIVILKLVDAVIGLRVEPEDEAAGLDVSQHGEAAYNE